MEANKGLSDSYTGFGMPDRNPREEIEKQKAHREVGLLGEKSFWANARMARETLPHWGVYATLKRESRANSVENYAV